MPILLFIKIKKLTRFTKTRSVKNAVNWNNISWLMESNCIKNSKFDDNDYICGGLIFQENNDYFAHCVF